LLAVADSSQAQALADEIVDRIRSSVLCVSNEDGDATATAIVWDYTDTEVLLLTNYHTWDSAEFRYAFPPDSAMAKRKGKRKGGHTDDQDVTVRFHYDNGDFSREVTITSSVFCAYAKDEDFAVLKIPRTGFNMPRIPISLNVTLTLKIHAFGYIGHSKQFNVSGGEISGLITEGFTMNLLSAGGYSGAAILVDGYGRAVGYMGGNYDASNNKNSQHQSYAFRFDRVMHDTGRQSTPTSSPAGKPRSKPKGASGSSSSSKP
jgi:hypothetical protein